jgi:pilus assembly protein CpaE
LNEVSAVIRLVLGIMPEQYTQAVTSASDIELMGTVHNDNMADAVRAYKPEMVLMSVDGDVEIEIARRIVDDNPEISVIIITANQSPELLKQAMRAGIKDSLEATCTALEVLASIRLVYERSENQLRKTQSTILMDQLHHQSRVIVLVSAKGGVGKTTTTVNVGVTMANAGKKVVIVDMDLAFGDVNLRLGLSDSPRNIYSLMLEGERYQEVFASYLNKHESGVYVLSAPLSVEEGEYVTASYVQGLIRTLKKDFDYVLVDTSPVMNDDFLTVWEAADQVLMISVADLASVKNNRRMLNILQTLGYALDKVKHVSVKKGTLSERHATDVLESEFYATIAFDGLAVGAAADLGIPVVTHNRYSKAARDFQRLGEKLLAEENRSTKSKLYSRVKLWRTRARRRV